MTWRPSKYLIEGEFDNTQAGRITGWLQFAGMPTRVEVDLQGDFCADIKGARIRIENAYPGKEVEASAFMEGFATRQVGRAGHITAGLAPCEWTDYPYLEWWSQDNDRVVLLLEPWQVRVLRPAPAALHLPVPRAAAHP